MTWPWCSDLPRMTGSNKKISLLRRERERELGCSDPTVGFCPETLGKKLCSAYLYIRTCSTSTYPSLQTAGPPARPLPMNARHPTNLCIGPAEVNLAEIAAQRAFVRGTSMHGRARMPHTTATLAEKKGKEGIFPGRLALSTICPCLGYSIDRKDRPCVVRPGSTIGPTTKIDGLLKLRCPHEL